MRFMLLFIFPFAYMGGLIALENYLDQYGYYYAGAGMVIVTLICEWPHKETPHVLGE